MPDFLASKVVVTEEAPTTRVFAPSPAAVTGIVGTAARGPLGQPTLCNSYEEFEKIFGSYAANADLPQSAKAFFDNGGTTLWVVRTAHYSDVANADTVTARRAKGALVTDSKPTIDVQALDCGAFGNSVRLDMRGANEDVEIDVIHEGARVEAFLGMSFDIESERHVAKVINASSAWVRLMPRGDAGTPLEPQSVQLVGGDDGLAGLTALDFIGSATVRTGMRALDLVLDISLLCIPSASAEVQHAMAAYAQSERRGRVFALFSAPARSSAQAAVAYVMDERFLESTEHAAMYWPRILVDNPALHIFGAQHVAVPPCAFVAGVMARLAAQSATGIYTPPAGIDAAQLIGAVGFDHDDCLEERKRDLVFPKRINPLTTGPSLPLFIDGARTLKSTGLCPYVSHRRGMSYIEGALWRQLQYIRHRPVTSTLLGRVHRDVNAYLLGQMALGAFASQVPAEAFALRVARSSVSGVVEILVGTAFATPGEFVWLRLNAYNSDAGVQP